MKLIKTVLNEGIVLVESSGQLPHGVLARIRGPFSGYGTAGKNRRTYSRQLWEKVIKEHGDSFKTRTCLGEADHPETEDVNRVASYSIPRVSHVITDLKLVGGFDKGIVEGEADILDTPAGRIVYTLLKAGVPVGVSVRALGEVDESGWVVSESYHFVSFDFVLNPSFEKARIESIMAESTKTLFESEILKGLLNSDLRAVKEGEDIQVKEVTPTTFIYETREVKPAEEVVTTQANESHETAPVEKEPEVESVPVVESNKEKEELVKQSLQSISVLLHEAAKLQYRLRRAETTAKTESESVKIQLQAVTEKMKKEIETAINDLKVSYESASKALANSHAAEIAKLNEEHDKALRVGVQTHSTKLEEVSKKFKQDIAKLEGVHRTEMASLTAKMNDATKTLKEQSDSATAALTKVQEITSKLEEATKEVSSLTAQVTELKKYESIHRRYYKSLEGTSILSSKSESKGSTFAIKLERL